MMLIGASEHGLLDKFTSLYSVQSVQKVIERS